MICPAARRDARTGTGNRNRIPCVSSKCFKERLILQNSKHFRYQGIKLRRFKNAKITEKCNSVLFKTRLGGQLGKKMLPLGPTSRPIGWQLGRGQLFTCNIWSAVPFFTFDLGEEERCDCWVKLSHCVKDVSYNDKVQAHNRANTAVIFTIKCIWSFNR